MKNAVLMVCMMAFLTSKPVDTVIVKRLMAEDWQIYKQLFIDGLEHDPKSFGYTLDEIIIKDDYFWKEYCKANILLCAFCNNEPVGIAGFELYGDFIYQMRHKGYIFGVYVRPVYRKKGIAQLLMQNIIKEARCYSIEYIICGVLSTNKKVVPFYEKLGFEIYSTESRGIKHTNGTYADIINMRMSLTKKKKGVFGIFYALSNRNRN